jgi:hypothetical protein
VDSLDEELQELVQADALCCRSCTHGYPAHEDAGGHCRHVIAGVMPCPCAGFQWVDPAGPPVGSYGDPPGR